MPSQGYPDGIFLVRRQSELPGIAHYGVMDIGNCLNLYVTEGSIPVVIDLTQAGIALRSTLDITPWELMGQAEDEQAAAARLWEAIEDKTYRVLSNNCEHFARMVVGGIRESKQLQAYSLLAGTMIVLALMDAEKRRRK